MHHSETDTISDDELDEVFMALSDRTRRAIVGRLLQGPATMGELAEPFLHRLSLPAVTKHVQVLERCGLVTKTREAQFRTCTLQLPRLNVAASWLLAQRDAWDARLDRLDTYLKTVGVSAGAVASSPAPLPPVTADQAVATTRRKRR